MVITRTYKYKLYRSKQNKHLHQQIDVAGIIYNHCIALHRRYYRLTGKHLNANQLMKHITKLKKLDKYAFWNLVGSQAIQDIVQRIDRAYKLFFRNLKAGIKTAPPQFKKVKKYTSFTLKQAGWKLLGGNRIRIQGRIYKFSKSREIPATVKTVTIKRDSLGDCYLYFVVQEEIELPNRQGHISAGFDFGLKTFLTASDGSAIDSPLFLKQSLDQLKQAQCELSRKVKFSRGWHKAKAKVARIHWKIVNQRRDWFFKLAHTLTDRYDCLFFEDLTMKGMQALWGRKIGDLARSEFMAILEYVAQCKGKLVGYVDRFFPSSKTCSACGHLYQDLDLSERRWICVACGVIHDRDQNAALNIEREGASSHRLGDVRPGVTAVTLRALAA
ncbi:transposase [Chloroflexi bacterium TSY]|nr:transposase [Chloroflexi bacterium TSY]